LFAGLFIVALNPPFLPDVSDRENPAIGDRHRRIGFADLFRLPQNLQPAFRPFFQEARFFGNPRAIRAAPLRPIFSHRSVWEMTGKHKEQDGEKGRTIHRVVLVVGRSGEGLGKSVKHNDSV
jgi:hypothetical protein